MTIIRKFNNFFFHIFSGNGYNSNGFGATGPPALGAPNNNGPFGNGNQFENFNPGNLFEYT